MALFDKKKLFKASCYYFCAVVQMISLMCALLQGCIKRLISEPHGTTDPDVRRLGGPYANSSVPHEQCHHGVGLQKHVQWKTNRSQLSGEAFVEVSVHKVKENISCWGFCTVSL